VKKEGKEKTTGEEKKKANKRKNPTTY